VPDTSAKLNGHLSEGIHANHMDMARFEDEEDPGFKKVANQIWRCMQEILKPKNGSVRSIGPHEPWEPSPGMHTSPDVGPSGVQRGAGAGGWPQGVGSRGWPQEAGPRGWPQGVGPSEWSQGSQGVGPIGVRQGNQIISGGFVTQGDQSTAMGGNWT
jgi:hypothetical protein